MNQTENWFFYARPELRQSTVDAASQPQLQQEGPMRFETLEQKIKNQLQFNHDHPDQKKFIYVWHEGMTEWKIYSSLKEFEHLDSPVTTSAGQSTSSSETESTTVNGILEKKFKLRSLIKKNTILKTLRVLIPLGAILVLIFAASQLTTMTGSRIKFYQFPVIGRLFSPLSQTTDLDSESRQLLESAIWSSQPALQFVSSSREILSPMIYIAATVEDGARAQVNLRGIPETLLSNKVSRPISSAEGDPFFIKQEVFFQNSLAKTQPLKMTEGALLPRGEYWIEVVITDSQKENLKGLRSEKKLFLGGPQDDSYRVRLKEYHDQLQAQAKDEFVEISQFEAFYRQIFDELLVAFNDHYSKLIVKRSRKLQISWQSKSSDTVRQLNELKEKLDSQKSVFYPGFIAEMTRLTTKMDSLIESQNQLIQKRISSYHVLYNEYQTARDDLSLLLTNLHRKLEKIQTTPVDERGLPSKWE